MTQPLLRVLVTLLVLLGAAPAQAQIAFRAASSATATGITPAFRSAASATTTGATLTITKPSGVAANDVLIASIGLTPSSGTIAPPSGWTLVRRTNNAGPTSNSLAVYRKVAGGSEPASYAWGMSGSSFTVGGVQAFTGVDTLAFDSRFAFFSARDIADVVNVGDIGGRDFAFLRHFDFRQFILGVFVD